VGAIGRRGLDCVVHRRRHSFGPAAQVENRQRLLRECRTGLAVVQVVGEARIGCLPACCADSLPDCLALAEVPAECLGQRIESFDVVGTEDMRVRERTWQVKWEREPSLDADQECSRAS
jgi:hypothetical protein